LSELPFGSKPWATARKKLSGPKALSPGSVGGAVRVLQRISGASSWLIIMPMVRPRGSGPWQLAQATALRIIPVTPERGIKCLLASEKVLFTLQELLALNLATGVAFLEHLHRGLAGWPGCRCKGWARLNVVVSCQPKQV
jgi:hypothetical protein